LDQECRNHPVDRLQDRREQLRMSCEQHAQRYGKRDHPLPYRHPGDDVIDQVRGRLGHAPGATARTDATPFATKGDELLMGTVGATQT
jgi:hypothetical protein